MKDTSRQKNENRPEDSPVWPPASLTPEQRRLVHRGMRIWARVAIRSYIRKKEAGSLLSKTSEDGRGEENRSGL